MVNEVNGHSEHGSRDMTPMTYEAFAKLYHATFATMMSYSPNQVGSAIYVEKLAALSDDHPVWAELVENE